jgi:murein DD-endopeptidase MepM/ murein hydrolase activator NlpD
VVLTLVLLLCAAQAVPAAGSVLYRPPVDDAPVLDPFRPPEGPYGAGNRGLEYATQPGSPVHVIGDGVVAFAGPVAGRLVVSVEHPDGLRSSLTGLASVSVATGAVLRLGDLVGLAGGRLHLGVRRDGTYLDPASLMGRGVGGAVHLVPTRPSTSMAPGGAAHPEARAPTRTITPVRCPPACKA